MYFQFRTVNFIVLLKYSPQVQALWLSAFLRKRMPNCQNVPTPAFEAYHTEGNAYWCKAPSYCSKSVYLSQRSRPYRPSTHLNTDTLQTYQRTSVPPTVRFPPHYASWYKETMTIGNPLNVMCGEAAHSFPPDFPPSHAGRAPFSAPGLPSD